MDKAVTQAMQPNQTDIALLNNNIQYIQRDIAAINANLKELAGVYPTKISVDDAFKAVNLRIHGLESSSTLQKWLSPTVASVVSSALTYLLIFYLSHLK